MKKKYMTLKYYGDELKESFIKFFTAKSPQRSSSTLGEKELEATIKEIQSINLESISIEQLKEKIKYLVHGYASATRYLKKGSVFFRARVNSFIEKPYKFEPFVHLDHLWCPSGENEKKIGIGRLNREKQAVLYVAQTMITAIKEVRPNDGDSVTVIRYTSNEDLELHSVGLYDFDNSVRSQQGKLYDKKKIQEFYKNNSYSIKFNESIEKFIINCFTSIIKNNEKFNYKITIAFFELMQEFINCEGIDYPSITANLSDRNYALNPNIALNKLIPTDVIIVAIRGDISSNEFETIITHQSQNIDSYGFIQYEEIVDKVDKNFFNKWRIPIRK